jgi:UDP-N-acetylglucosamine 2-epimerase (non-hydrolysing)
MKKKILTIVGTRPEAIKLAPLILELQSRANDFESIVCATGQHREMLDQVFETFEIKTNFDLNLMAPNQSLAQITARATQGLDEVFAKAKPDVCIVQGDTTTAFCGALVGHYHHCAIGHVEAGLRTGNKFAPFPEEMNRRLVGRLADLHFAPTSHSQQALLNEGIEKASVFVTGNTVIDALLWVRDRVAANTPEQVRPIEKLIGQKQTVLVTGHRRESFGSGFESMCQAIRQVADEQSQTEFVYPVHLNPNVQKPVNRILGDHPRIHLVEPLSYEPFVWLMNRSTVVLTDSGGVQEEAPSLGKPVLVMRETTERPEGVDAGNAKLVGVSREKIVSELTSLLTDENARQQMATVKNPYGDGTAAKKIADVLAAHSPA